jgi:hypothetical protein
MRSRRPISGSLFKHIDRPFSPLRLEGKLSGIGVVLRFVRRRKIVVDLKSDNKIIHSSSNSLHSSRATRRPLIYSRLFKIQVADSIKTRFLFLQPLALL